MTVNVQHLKNRYNIQTTADLTAAGETTTETLNLDTGHNFIQTSKGRILLVSDWKDDNTGTLITGFVRDVTQMYTNPNYVAGQLTPHTAEHKQVLKDTIKISSTRLSGLSGSKQTLLNSIKTIIG